MILIEEILTQEQTARFLPGFLPPTPTYIAWLQQTADEVRHHDALVVAVRREAKPSPAPLARWLAAWKPTDYSETQSALAAFRFAFGRTEGEPELPRRPPPHPVLDRVLHASRGLILTEDHMRLVTRLATGVREQIETLVRGFRLMKMDTFVEARKLEITPGYSLERAVEERRIYGGVFHNMMEETLLLRMWLEVQRG